MPTLQGLPQELLEMIFLYSMNISLPRASPDLGRTLSSKTICTEFCMRNLFGWNDRKEYLPRDHLANRLKRDPIIQSEVLGCRFFTWSFFLHYVQRAQDAFIKFRGKIWEQAGVAIPDVTYFEGLWPFKFTKINYLGFVEGFRIPEKLLHGPWTPDKTSLLYVLVSFSGEIDWEGSTAGETAKEGLKQAIEEGNERAVAALSVLLGVARAITTETLYHAVVECGCNFALLRHLLFNAQILYFDNRKENLDFHEPVLWQWADGEGKANGKGEILKDMLKKAETFELEFYKEGETDWMDIVAFPYSGEKFNARTGFDELVRALLTRLYRNYGRRITGGSRTGLIDGHIPTSAAAAEAGEGE